MNVISALVSLLSATLRLDVQFLHVYNEEEDDGEFPE